MPPKFDLTAYLDAWHERDMDRVLEFYADEVRFSKPGLERPLEGKQAYRESAEEFLGAFEDLRASDLRIQAVTDDTVAFCVTGMGVHAKDLGFADGRNVPATRKKIRMDFADFMRLDEQGRIKEEILVYDTGALLRQLGVAPEAAAAPSR